MAFVSDIALLLVRTFFMSRLKTDTKTCTDKLSKLANISFNQIAIQIISSIGINFYRRTLSVD